MSFSTEILTDAYVSRYANLAGAALLSYDYLLTLDDEIEFIWKKSWSIGKALFIMSRYYPLISTVVVNNYVLFGSQTRSGIQYGEWQGWSGLVTCMLVETILQMRLYALYFLNKKILLLMVIGFVVSSGSTALVLVILYKGHVTVQPEIPFCLPLLPAYCYAVWIPRLAFDTFLCVLALVRGFQLACNEHGSSEYTIPSGKHLIRVLIKDCIGSYLMMFAVYLTFLTIWARNANLIETCFNLSLGFESIVGTRTILGIRKVIQNDGPEVSPSMANDMLR
ncbi:hypothetical protein F5050DRAFT_1758880 [Lentinula boryana]|uniref:DUF6533 domain-containing protein n=1 Tax=Lentinula boryana TaxID=40481 RepID=A0ABQ8QD74_9AGAR|nr:hypothetical protein F5050DRAFT_1758880 [Lentinula boryana]